MKLRIISVILAFAALVGFGTAIASSATAAPRSISGPPYTTVKVYAATSDASTAVKYAVRQWNKATNVELQQVSTPCSGPLCIVVRFVEAHDPGTCGNFVGGCEYTDVNGTTQVTVTNNLYLVANRRVTQDRIAKSITIHEIGHGLGLDHRDPAVDPDTVMGWMVTTNPIILSPSAQDLALVDEMWADGYEAPAA